MTKFALVITRKYESLIEDKFYPFVLIGEIELGRRAYLIWGCKDLKQLKKVPKIFEGNIIKVVGVEV